MPCLLYNYICKHHVKSGRYLVKRINKNSAIPFYLQVKEEIIKFAKNNDSAKALPHHGELAHIFGTSRVTVAKAISELKKEKILNSVKGRGTFLTGEKPYARNHAVIEKKNLITLIFPSGEASPIFQGCQREAEKNGYQILLKNDASQEDKKRQAFLECERNFLIRYRDGEFGDSLIIYYEGGNDNLDIVKDIIKAKKPVVFIDRFPSSLSVDYVGYDNFDLGRRITEEFINMGKRNIAIIGTGKAISSTQEQANGYMKALEDHEIEFKKENVILDVDFVYYYQEEEIKRLKERFHDIKDKVDAIYFMSAFPEWSILGELNASDLKTDVVLAGAITIPWFQDRYAFKVKWPSAQLGEEAVKMLNAKLISEDRTKTEQIKLQAELIPQGIKARTN